MLNLFLIVTLTVMLRLKACVKVLMLLTEKSDAKQKEFCGAENCLMILD